MKRTYRFFVFLLLIFEGNRLSAQALCRYAVKVDLLSAVQKQIALAGEWRFSNKYSFELQCSYQQHNSLPPDIFNGDWTAGYALRKTYFVRWGSTETSDETEWEYLGTGRPLPTAPPSIIALSTMQIRLGYRFTFENKQTKRPHIFLQSGISVARHDFMETTDYTIVTNNDTQSWQIGAETNELQAVVKTMHYQQVRQMRAHNHWIGGAFYTFGTSWQPGSNFLLEVRTTIGMNFGNGPYEMPKPPTNLTNFYGQIAIHAGYAFGKKQKTPSFENL